jgi:hypothetical protein
MKLPSPAQPDVLLELPEDVSPTASPAEWGQEDERWLNLGDQSEQWWWRGCTRDDRGVVVVPVGLCVYATGGDLSKRSTHCWGTDAVTAMAHAMHHDLSINVYRISSPLQLLDVSHAPAVQSLLAESKARVAEAEQALKDCAEVPQGSPTPLLTPRESDILSRNESAGNTATPMGDRAAIAGRLTNLWTSEVSRVQRNLRVVSMATGMDVTAEQQRQVVPKELAPQKEDPSFTLGFATAEGQTSSVTWGGQEFGAASEQIHRMALPHYDDVLVQSIAHLFPTLDGYFSRPQPSLWHGVLPAEMCVLSPAKSLSLDADLTAEFTGMLADLRKSNAGTLEKARSAMLPRQLISLRVPMRIGKVEGGAGASKAAARVPAALTSRMGTALDYALFMDNPLDKNDTRHIEAVQDFWFRPGKPMSGRAGDASRRGGPPRGPQGRPLGSVQQGRR